MCTVANGNGTKLKFGVEEWIKLGGLFFAIGIALVGAQRYVLSLQLSKLHSEVKTEITEAVHEIELSVNGHAKDTQIHQTIADKQAMIQAWTEVIKEWTTQELKIHDARGH